MGGKEEGCCVFEIFFVVFELQHAITLFYGYLIISFKFQANAKCVLSTSVLLFCVLVRLEFLWSFSIMFSWLFPFNIFHAKQSDFPHLREFHTLEFALFHMLTALMLFYVFKQHFSYSCYNILSEHFVCLLCPHSLFWCVFSVVLILAKTASKT